MPSLPTATYRIQFSPEFGFANACSIVPYLHRLGVSHVYASPIFAPRPGSQHGYDVIDPSRLNPELGEDSEFEALLDELRRHGMGLILDIVPNHMAASSDNPWWRDVLENGPSSAYSNYFDIRWGVHPGGDADSRLVLPVLGDHFGSILERGELALAIDEDGLAIRYFEHRFPLDPATINVLLNDIRQEMLDGHSDGMRSFDVLDQLIDAVRRLPPATTKSSKFRRTRRENVPAFGKLTWRLYRMDSEISAAFDAALTRFNGEAGRPRSFDRLEAMIDQQPWRLTFWRRASEEVNYRRFFDIADLASVRVEDPDVFDALHTFILELAEVDGIDGVRADHVDGLRDPIRYAEQLRAALDRQETGDHQRHLVLIEKILTGEEPLPTNWDVDGTTGYEFAHRVNAVLADPVGFNKIENHYRDLIGADDSFAEVVFRSKALVLDQLFFGEFHLLTDGLTGIARRTRRGRDLSQRQLADALRALIIVFPVYRTYITQGGVTERDRSILQSALQEAKAGENHVEDHVWEFLNYVLYGDLPESLQEQRQEWIDRWQQFTGPLMAKGLEDTALYAYTPLLSLNEVGGEPESISVEQFHAHNVHIAEHWPNTMLTTSTHDTKRSADVRGRVGVLSEFAEEWIRLLSQWREYNAHFRHSVDGILAPDPNDEQFIYQNLIGAWPLSPGEFPGFLDRVKEYMTKATRESKRHSSWIYVNELYEDAVHTFIDRILGQDPGTPFMRELIAFQTRISSYGAWNSLSQLVLKLTSPGFPDIYQGNELWDFSLADPDNRRPVDYGQRAEQLDALASDSGQKLPEMVNQWRDGRIKLAVTTRLLQLRRSHPNLFQGSDYQPLRVVGERSDNVIAFARSEGVHVCITLVPRLTGSLVPVDTAPVGMDVWGDTRVILPDSIVANRWTDVLTGESTVFDGHEIHVGQLLRTLPVTVLVAE